MKSIKYLLTAILMVSTGLSAMEPVQNFDEEINQRIKQGTAPIRVGLGLAGGFMALETLSAISQYGLSNLDTLKHSMVASALVGLASSIFLYSLDYGKYKDRQEFINYYNKTHPQDSSSYFNPKPYERAFELKSDLVRNYPLLHLKHSTDTTTEGFKYAFGAPFALFGGLCAVNALSGLSK